MAVSSSFRVCFFLAAALAGSSFFCPAVALHAANVAAPVVWVGADIISNKDVDDRCRLISLLSGREKDTEFQKKIRQQVIQQLVDERVYAKIAEQSKMGIGAKEDDAALADYSKNFGFEPKKFEDGLKKQGLLSTFRQMVRARVVHSYLLAGALHKDLARVSDEEIDAELARQKESVQKRQVFVGEIVLSSHPGVSASESAKNARNTHAALQELAQKMPMGEAFRMLARQLSQGPTAADGGIIGWVREDQLNPSMKNGLNGLKVKEISDVVATERAGEYRIFFLEDVREPGYEPVSQSILKMVHVKVPFSPDASQEEKAGVERRLGALMECTSGGMLEEMAKEFGYTSQRMERKLGTVLVSPEALVMNRCLEPFFSGSYFEIVMPLSLERIKRAQLPSREEIENMLEYVKRNREASRIFREQKTRLLIKYAQKS